MALTEKQVRFVEFILAGNTATQAATKAGYSRNSASDIGSENLTKPDIIQAIEAGRAQRRQKANLVVPDMVEEMHALAYFNVQDFLEEGNKIKDLSAMSPDDTRPVTAIKTKESFMPDGTRVVTTELKFVDKHAAQVDLFRYMGLFDRDNSQKKPQIDLNNLQLPNISTDDLFAFLQGKKA